MSSDQEWPCTKEEALAAVRAKVAFWQPPECERCECEKCGATYEPYGMEGALLYRKVPFPIEQAELHTMSGTFGSNCNLAGIEACIEEADDIAWVDHLVGHDLYVGRNGRGMCIDISRPEASKT